MDNDEQLCVGGTLRLLQCVKGNLLYLFSRVGNVFLVQRQNVKIPQYLSYIMPTMVGKKNTCPPYLSDFGG